MTSEAAVRRSATLVSVCVPTYQGAMWVRDAIGSALRQTHRAIEVVVVDDGSTDGTPDVVRSIADDRIRLHVNPRNLGLVRNWDRCLRLARGHAVKFLFQDDLLEATCVEQMLKVMDLSADVGFVFCRRRIAADATDDPAVRAWVERYGTLDERLGRLDAVNDGRRLFRRMKRVGFRENWVGEPTAVLLRRSAVVSVGGFNARLAQLPDLEMWLRLMHRFEVGFIPDRLVTFRVHTASASSRNRSERADAYDLPWLIEGLRADDAISRENPDLRWMGLRFLLQAVAREAARAVRTRRRAATPSGAGLRAYLRHRLHPRTVRPLHEPMAS